MTALLATLAALQIVQIIVSGILEMKRMKIDEQVRRGAKFL